jgi:quinol monooxygenase YgiN
MVTLFVKHAVKDYANWKRAYDSLGPTRQAMGVVGASVHRDANDPNLITVTHQFDDLNSATAFVDSEDLRATMMRGGVEGEPDVWFAEDIESTAY